MESLEELSKEELIKRIFFWRDLAGYPRGRRDHQYYWGPVLETISRATGHTKTELHEFFKKFIICGESTTKLKRKSFSEFLSHVIAEASQIGIFIPEPTKDDVYGG